MRTARFCGFGWGEGKPYPLGTRPPIPYLLDTLPPDTLPLGYPNPFPRQKGHETRDTQPHVNRMTDRHL